MRNRHGHYQNCDSVGTDIINDREEKAARSCRRVSRPPIDIGAVKALVCGLPTAIKGRAARHP